MQKIKKIFLGNIVKFIIGIILLTFALMYLQTNQAEKTSLLSGFDILTQKVQIAFMKATNKDRKNFVRKKELEKNYQMILQEAKDNECFDTPKLHEMTQKYSHFTNMSVEEFTKEIYQTQRYFANIQQTMSTTCRTE